MELFEIIKMNIFQTHCMASYSCYLKFYEFYEQKKARTVQTS